MTDYSLWEVIKNGNKVLKRTVGETEQEYEPTTAEEKQDRRNKMKARGTLLMALPNKDQLKFHSYKDEKLLMEAIEKSNSSTNEADKLSDAVICAYGEVLHVQIQRKSQFNLVSYKEGLESVETRLAHYKKNEAVFEESINVLKHEVKLRDTTLVENKKKLEKAEKESDEFKLTLEKFQNASKSLNNLLESQVINKFKSGLGYNAASSTAVESFVNSSEMLENQDNNKSKSDKGYHAVPPPFTGNFIPRKADLTFMDEIVESENLDVTTVVTPSNVKTVESNLEFAGVKNNGDAREPKTVRKNSFRPPDIED
ncbi:hypothetical protein Tco_1096061 [Tanacetum coccineum]